MKRTGTPLDSWQGRCRAKHDFARQRTSETAHNPAPAGEGPKRGLIKIEVAVATDQVDKTIDTITSAAKTGQIGDGKIFVLSIDTAVRIRTGETDTAAL